MHRDVSPVSGYPTIMFYKFARMHETLTCSPAMAADISRTPWSMEDVAALIDARAEKPTARGA